MHLVLEGAVLGFLVAAPVGPIGLLCITRTLRAGWLVGFLSGLGTAVADAVYASIAAFGIRSVTVGIEELSWTLHLAGAAILGFIGARMLCSKRDPQAAPSALNVPALAALGSTLLLTLVNPSTMISFAAMGAAAMTRAPSAASAVALTTGVFCGSAAWWLVLATSVAISRRVVTAGLTRAIDRLSGAALIAFAAATVAF